MKKNPEKLDDGKMKTVFKKPILLTSFTLISGIFFLLGGIMTFLFFDDLVNAIIRSQIPIIPGSQVEKPWKEPPVKPLLKLYFFNVTNEDDFRRGAKPVLDEIGPYVYEQKWIKENVSWSEDLSYVEYDQIKTYFFSRNLSVGYEEDLLVLPNIPMISAIGGKTKYKGVLVISAITSLLGLLHIEPFTKVTVKEILWGMDSPLIEFGNDVLPEEEKLPFDQFGLFYGKNGTNLGSGRIRAETGSLNAEEVGEILTVDGKDKLSFWKTEECNKISGTDGSVFHPGISEADTLNIFNKDLCRSLPLVYEKSVNVNGIPAFRFTPPENVFGTPDENSYNQCFCERPDNCMGTSGLFNLSKCQFDSPIALSWPHFYQADPKLLDAVIGLKPDKEKHQFFLDVQPNLGTAVRAQARTQINLVMEDYSYVTTNRKSVEGLREMIFPVAWFSDGIEEIDDPETIQIIKGAVFAPQTARKVMYPSLLVLSGLAFALFVVLMLRNRRHNGYDSGRTVELQQTAKPEDLRASTKMSENLAESQRL